MVTGEPIREFHDVPDGGQFDNRADAGSICGNVVQARDVRGGIHLYSELGQYRSIQLTPKQLPATARVFVNRNRELSELGQSVAVGELQEPQSVVVIVGSAGVGKTALALHWTHGIRDKFVDGDLFVSLRGYDASQPVSAAAVLERVLRDLGVPPDRIPIDIDDRVVLFRSMIAGRRLLILADNASSASQVRPLIPGAPGPLLVVTSRSRMPGLAVRNSVKYIQVDLLEQSDAVALVHEVTQHDRPQDDAADVAELARLCARLPLALRIVAERAVSRPAMGLVELIDDLRDASELWEILSMEDKAETDDVRTVFAWSYRSLPEQAASMFRVIGLHPGDDISLQAAAAAAGTSVRDARRSTDVLVGAFLLDRTSSFRYQMHDLLRAYANAESRICDSESERRSILDRMFCWYARSVDNACAMLAPDDRLRLELPTAQDVSPEGFTTANEALTWFEAERQNLLTAARLAEASNMPKHSLALALAPSPVYMNYFYFDDWSEMTLIGLRSAAVVSDVRNEASAQENRGKYLLRRGKYSEAKLAFAEALRMYEQIADKRGGAESMNSLGLVCLRLRDLKDAVRLFASAAETFSDLGELRWLGVCRSNLAEARIDSGDISAVLNDLNDLLLLFERLGDVPMQGNTLWLLARAYRIDGSLARAKAAIEDALAIAETAHNKMWGGFWLIEAARIQLDFGDTADAMLSCQAAASLQRQIGDRSREALVFQCTGDVLRRMHRTAEANAFYLQAARQFHDLGEMWNEALARLGAADCAASLGQFKSEREQLDLVRTCLAPYSDERAMALKREAVARLG